MKSTKLAVFATLFVLCLGLADAGAQAFSFGRAKGNFEVKFLPPIGGQVVQVFIDDQNAGTLPLTVYVQPGAHKFTFVAPGEEPKTIVYPVKGDTVVPSLFTAQSYPLTVNTNVPGAALAIDGRPFPGNATSVAPGNHNLTVSAPGYLGITLPFTQPANANTLNVTLVANTFPLTVNTNVPTASMAIDGVGFAGRTTSVSPGNHTLTLSAPGYQALTLPFTQPANAHTLNVTLVANTFSLTVNTNVPGAALAIDGIPFAGNTTTTMAGNHTLTASAPGYQHVSIPFVQPSNPNTLNVTLVASTYPLTVNTNVPGAALAIDGVPFAGNATAVMAGNHTLTVSAPGYQAMTLPFVQPANPNTLNVTLVAATGTLQINTDRLGQGGPVRVFVDGKDSRGSLLTLLPGQHQIRLVSGGTSIETTVTIASGQNLTLTPSVQWDLR